MPSTPFVSLDHITDTPRIITFIKGEAAKGASRLQAYKDWSGEKIPLRKGTIKHHTTLNNKYLDDLQLPKAEKDLTKSRLSLKMNYNIDLPDREEISNIINQISPDAITCYTDGSKTDQGTGYGYIITTSNNNNEILSTSAKLPDFCTVHQAELTALTAAGESLLDYTNKNIYLLTDSQSALYTLNNTTMNSNTAINCHGALNDLATNNTVTVMWVAGHEGHWGNERADQLAKEGTAGDNLTKGYLPQSLIKHTINQNVRNQDANNWTTKGHKHTKMTLGNKQQHILTDLKKLHNNRKDYRLAVQLITGHAGLNNHLYKMQLATSKTCPQCDYTDETVEHFLGQCPAFAGLRGEVFNCFYTSIADIFENHSILKIVSYANKTKRLIFNPVESDQSGVT